MMEPKTPKRKRRNNKDIEQSIIKAAVELIADKGFLELAVTNIFEKAKIEPIVFYNRYRDLNEFINEFVKDYDYWFSDIVNECKTKEDEKSKYTELLQSLLRSLKGNKIMQHLLKWELSTQNEVTQRTAQLREVNTLPLVKEYGSLFSNTSIDIVAISALIVGGIYYLILHSNLSSFSGIDISTDEGEERIVKAIEFLSDTLFAKLSSEEDKITNIIKKMKQNNIEVEVIADCTGVPIDIIKRI